MDTAIQIINDMLQYLSEEATKEKKSDNLIRYYIVLEQISLVKILKVRIQIANKELTK